MEAYTFRRATLIDIPFLVDAIVAAEKSGTENLGLAKLFDLSENELREYLTQALKEEIEGCEFSVSSFIVANYEGRPVATFGGWIEGQNEDDLPSSILKSNLVGFCFPKENVLISASRAPIVTSLQIEREPGTYQLEYSYTAPEHRGKGLVGIIIEKHIDEAKRASVMKMQVHVFDNNVSAIRAYQNKGFKIVAKFLSEHPHSKYYFPSNVVLLMEKELKNN